MNNSLKDIISRKDVSPKVLALLQRQLLDELLNLETEYTLTPEHIIISEDRKKIWLDNFPEFTGNEEDSTPNYRQLIKEYGSILRDALAVTPNPSPRLEKIAHRCIEGDYESIPELQLALEKRISNTIYIPLLIILAILIFILAWFS